MAWLHTIINVTAVMLVIQLILLVNGADRPRAVAIIITSLLFCAAVAAQIHYGVQ